MPRGRIFQADGKYKEPEPGIYFRTGKEDDVEGPRERDKGVRKQYIEEVTRAYIKSYRPWSEVQFLF